MRISSVAFKSIFVELPDRLDPRLKNEVKNSRRYLEKMDARFPNYDVYITGIMGKAPSEQRLLVSVVKDDNLNGKFTVLFPGDCRDLKQEVMNFYEIKK